MKIPSRINSFSPLIIKLIQLNICGTKTLRGQTYNWKLWIKHFSFNGDIILSKLKVKLFCE